MVNYFPQLKINYVDGDIVYAGTDLAAQSGFNALSEACSNVPVLVHANRGIVTSITEVQADTKTFVSGDFAVGDTIMIELELFDPNINDSNAVGVFVRIADGTNTFNTTAITFATNTTKIFHIKYNITNASNYATTKLLASTLSYYNGNTPGTLVNQATMIANWITTAFTISLRTAATEWLSGTPDENLYWNWKIYRLRGS